MTSLWMTLALIAAEPRPVVIATDIGCCFDDPWAVAHLVSARDRFDVRAIVTSHSPDIKPPVAENALKAARTAAEKVAADRRVPMVAGSDVPLSKRRTKGIGDGAAALLEHSRAVGPNRRLTIVLIGPATDLALALGADPGFAERVEVVAMGFDAWPGGGDPYNVKNDVDAWRILLESRIPITVVDIAVTTRDLGLTRDQLKGRFPRLAEGALGLMDRNPALAEKLGGGPNRAVIWDEGATAVLLGYATIERRPRPRLRPDATFEHAKSEARIGWVTRIDAEKLWSDLDARLKSAAPSAERRN